MSEPRPRLVAVEGAAGERPAESREAAPRTAGRRARWGGWLLALLLLLALVALGLQTRRVGALSGEVASLTADLTEARSALVAYQGQLDDVRASVADLAARMGALDALVNRDPLAAPGEDPAPR